MTDREARAVALRTIITIIGAASSGMRGVKPAFEGNPFFTEAEKKKVRREWDRIEFQLSQRLNKLEHTPEVTDG